jgi:serine/threonine protein kinase
MSRAMAMEGEEFDELEALARGFGVGDPACLARLGSLVDSQAIRDTLGSLSEEGCGCLVSGLESYWNRGGEGGILRDLERLFGRLTGFDEFPLERVEPHMTDDFIGALLGRFELPLQTEGTISTSSGESHDCYARTLLHWVYSRFPRRRGCVRGAIGAVLSRFIRTPSKRVQLGPLLEVVGQVARGFRVPLCTVHRDLLVRLLLPLHAPNEMAEWRDQTPLLAAYHEPLVYAVVQILEKDDDKKLAAQCIAEVLRWWPEGFNSNTPKEVLLLHELETLLHHVGPDEFQWLLPQFLPKLVRCLSVENSRVVEKALFMWQDEHFVGLLRSSSAAVMEPVVKALLRGGKLFWNPTVNKMTAVVLKKMEEMDVPTFCAVAEVEGQSWGGDTAQQRQEQERVLRQPQSGPPLAQKQQLRMPPIQPSATLWSKTSGTPPPVTVTGVAPWAFQQQQQASSQPRRVRARPAAPSPGDALSSASTSITPVPDLEASAARESGLTRVRKFMERLKPKLSGEDIDQTWHAMQMDLTPTLLPDLKFHDLVFGHNLGSGSFSTVRYARWIQKGKPRAAWPEYAVKEISKEMLGEMSYETSAANEVAVLRTLSHPGVARMVSAFRWRGAVYMVLEYAERGDLQSYLAQHGSLGQEAARWVVGEVTGALCYVHSAGFVYTDLKPENVLITHSGHIKLADFGAARPVTDSARSVLANSRKGLRELRDGDWRVKPAASGQASTHVHHTFSVDADDAESGSESDGHAEGTAAYLPPEVAGGMGRPSLPADAWALGCLLVQCLSGRPPVLPDTQGDNRVTLERVVRFAADSGAAGAVELLPTGTCENACSLIMRLLQPDPESRLPVLQVPEHPYFAGKFDVHAMHQLTPVELEAGPVPASTDPSWNRRQNSMIWAPMPTAFRLEGGGQTSLDCILEEAIEQGVSFLPPRQVVGRELPPLSEQR